jgi:3-oxoacyl-[acyl-carrier protein] reductase
VDDRGAALVTGAAGGIGLAIVDKLAQNGSDVFAHARLKSVEFESKLQFISDKYSVNVCPVYFDITDEEEMKSSLAQVLSPKVMLNVLVNNAGVAHGGLFQMTKVSDIRSVFEVNFFSHLNLTQLVLRRMLRNDSGSIVNISSIAGLTLRAGNSAYGASKAALIAWTKTLAVELGTSGIRVNAVAPGLTETYMAELMTPSARDEMLAASAMKRKGTPQEIASAVAYLVSSESSFVNGQILRVDGGES